ncbi:MAG TPA: hypothetical protein PKE45_12270 [Caldilineaceae bacterium]|nr:hypothetical protein [Caldilineaceae bacterium]
MEGQLVWFLLAGFLLGFACSTLWEWFYYRGVRRRNLAAQAPPANGYTAEPITTAVMAANEQPATESGYRSPAVFIEGEEQTVEHPSVVQPAYESASEQPVAATDSTRAAESSDI